MKKAFTLAEVLITLAIIGVIAALTVPSVIAGFQKKQTVVRLQKAYSEITNAFKMMELEHGPMEEWAWTSMGATSEERRDYFLTNYIEKYMKIVKRCDDTNFTECINYPVLDLAGDPSPYVRNDKDAVVTLSGYSIYFWFGGSMFLQEGQERYFSDHLHMLVDIDGPGRGKSIIGKDVFNISAFLGPQIETGQERAKHSGIWMMGKGQIPDWTREELMDLCDSEGRTCGALIQNDGWQIKSDYPW